MKEILKNLALFSLTQFCSENGIDCSGTHCEKDGRGFCYKLVRSEGGALVATITFHKTSVPTFTVGA